jgi:hypothetical protein
MAGGRAPAAVEGSDAAARESEGHGVVEYCEGSLSGAPATGGAG